MSSPTRFIMVALVGWVGVRAFSLGLFPGGEAWAFDRPAAATDQARDSASLPPVPVTDFPPLDPVEAPAPYPVASAYGPYAQAYSQPYAMPYPVPVYAAGMSRAPAVVRYAASPGAPRQWGPDEVQGFSLAPAAARYADSGTPLDQWPIAAIASGRSSPAARAGRSTPAELIRTIPGIDRLSMSGWAMMRREPGTPSLASNGQLGGSQAGARILWRFRRDLALSIRSSAPVGGVQRTAELAAGLRWQPLRNLPIALTAERRQSFGADKAPPAFAIFAEGGVYDRPIVAGFNLDAYLQAGVVGLRDRAGFVDGSATLTRPVWRQLSAGFGVWGGAQPGLARFDAGPRLSYRIGGKMRVHVDYRQRLLGHAAPGSGPVLTLAANF
jgi:hypothetical protein